MDQHVQDEEWKQRQLADDRKELEESKKRFTEAEAHAAKLRQESMRRCGVERAFAEAAEFASRQIRSDGLEGQVLPYGEVRYKVAQGLKAAVHAREDSIATLLLQRSILQRLDSIKGLLCLTVALLAFIAYKVA